MTIMQPASSDLENFIEFLYEGLEGYIYLAAQIPGDKTDWKQEFFHYPTEADRLASVIRAASKQFEVYLAPALYKEPTDGQRENFKVSNVVWTEFDGNAPDWTDSKAGEPSLIVQSSSETNQHVYWRLQSPITNPDTLEDINRRITYNLSADSSAWDCTQVLRPPEAYNHKRGLPVQLKVLRPVQYDTTLFDSLAPAPEQIDTSDWQISALPDVQDVILRHSFTEDVVQLLKKEKGEVKDRSVSLMNLAFGLCEMGLKDNEIFVLLKMTDDRWEKFSKRKDQAKRLAHIITVARNKYPDSNSVEEQFTMAFGWQSFLDTEIEIDWAIEPMLMDQGAMLMVGPPGIGKTQISLQFMIHLALGKSFMHYKIPSPKKLLFLSLEMGHGELKQFMEKMNKDLTDAERLLLEDNLIIIPHGEPWYLNTEFGQTELIKWLDAVQPEGLFVDSVGSSIAGNISSDEVVQGLNAFNDRIRKKYGLFTWYLHHTRKAQQGSNGYVSQDDIYGNQYLFARATSSYGILPAKNSGIKVRNFKNRLHSTEEDYRIERTENLNFTKVNAEVDTLIEKVVKSDTNEKPSAGNGFTL